MYIYTYIIVGASELLCRVGKLGCNNVQLCVGGMCKYWCINTCIYIYTHIYIYVYSLVLVSSFVVLKSLAGIVRTCLCGGV